MDNESREENDDDPDLQEIDDVDLISQYVVNLIIFEIGANAEVAVHQDENVEIAAQAVEFDDETEVVNNEAGDDEEVIVIADKDFNTDSGSTNLTQSTKSIEKLETKLKEKQVKKMITEKVLSALESRQHIISTRRNQVRTTLAREMLFNLDGRIGSSGLVNENGTRPGPFQRQRRRNEEVTKAQMDHLTELIDDNQRQIALLKEELLQVRSLIEQLKAQIKERREDLA